MLSITGQITASTWNDFFLLFVTPKHRVEVDKKNRPRSEVNSSVLEKQKDAVRCRACDAVITDTDQAVSRQGRHEHAFFNPAGIAFEVRCFQDARGCLVQGISTAEFSWFVQHRWQYAVCGSCKSHLGWFFTASTGGQERENSFFALIVHAVC